MWRRPCVVVAAAAAARRELFVVVNRDDVLTVRQVWAASSLARLRVEWQICGECDWQVEIDPGGTFQTRTNILRTHRKELHAAL